MKTVIGFLFLFCIVGTHSYSQIGGKKVDGPINFSGIKIYENDTLFLGTGSAPYGTFKYILQPPNLMAGTKGLDLPRSFAGQYLIIKHFKRFSSKRVGDKTIAVVNTGGFNWVVDLAQAIEVGEVIKINQKTMTSKLSIVPTTSVADELIKLKGLLDSGAITQDEYDAQKKKMLGN